MNLKTIVNKKTSSQIELVKYIAAIAMLLDHLGVLFFPTVSEFRIIGRLAYPLFGYVLVHNYVYYSTHKANYVKKIFIFALLFEPLHYFLFKSHYAGLSIFFMYAMALSFFYVFEKENVKKENKAILFFIFLAYSIFIEYSFIGYLLLISFYFAFIRSTLLTLLVVIFVTYFLNYPSVVYSLFTLLFVVIVAGVTLVNFQIPRYKYFFYFFYPLHMLFFSLMKYLF